MAISLRTNNITNATIRDSFISPLGAGGEYDLATGDGINSDIVINAGNGDVNQPLAGDNREFTLVITPDLGWCVAASAYGYEVGAPIESVTFEDSGAPLAADNTVICTVRLDDTNIDDFGNGNGIVEIDIYGDAQEFGVRFVTLSLVNDFATAVLSSPSGGDTTISSDWALAMEPSDSNLTEGWDTNAGDKWEDCFKNKKPLKFQEDSIIFTPALDYLDNEPIHFNSTHFHKTQNEEDTNINDGDVARVEDVDDQYFHESDQNKFIERARKDVIHVGLHCKVGVEQKVGTITLKLHQDLYMPHTSTSEGTSGEMGYGYYGTSPQATYQDWIDGKFDNYGRVFGWHRHTGIQPELDNNFDGGLTKHGFDASPNSFLTGRYGIGTVDNDNWRADGPTGLISTARRERYDHRSICDLPPISSGARFEGIFSLNEQWSIRDMNYVAFTAPQYPDSSSYLEYSGSVSTSPNDTSLVVQTALAWSSSGVINDLNQSEIDNAVDIASESLSNWSKQLYWHLDLHPFAWFPNWGEKEGAFEPVEQSTDITEHEVIKVIQHNTSDDYDGGFRVEKRKDLWEKWAPDGWQRSAIQNQYMFETEGLLDADTNTYVAAPPPFNQNTWGASFGKINTPLGQVGSTLSIDPSVAELTSIYTAMGEAFDDEDIEQLYPNTIAAYQFTTEALSNFYRTISFDIYYTEDGNRADQASFEEFIIEDISNPVIIFPDGAHTLSTINPIISDNSGIPRMKLSSRVLGLSTRFKWNRLNWRQILELGGYLSKHFWQVSEGSTEPIEDWPLGEYWIGDGYLRTFGNVPPRNFTNALVRNNGKKDRLEITDVNLHLGNVSDSGSYIIGPGGLSSNSDAYIEVKGDPNAEFEVLMREVENIEVEASGNTRSTMSDSPNNTILNGGWFKGFELDSDTVYAIGRDGRTRLKLPYIESISRTSGWKTFELTVKPVNKLDTKVSTVMKSTAGRLGDRSATSNSTNSYVKMDIFQYPKVDISMSITKESDWNYDPGYDISDVPRLGFSSDKALGTALSMVDDMTFINQSDKSVNFEIRVTKSGVFSINPRWINTVAELKNISFNNNASTITHSGENVITPGMLVYGDGIPSGAFITSVTSPTTFTLSANTTSLKSHSSLSIGSVIIDSETLNSSIITPKVVDNKDHVVFSSITAHIGRGLSGTESNYATVTGRVRYVKFGKQSQTYNLDLTEIFNHS